MGLGGAALIIAAIVIVWKLVAPGGVFSLARLIWLLVILAAIALLAWLVFWYHRLPLWLIGVWNAPNLPVVPIHLSELPGTVLKLGLRRSQMGQAANALTSVWTIGKYTEPAYTFMGMGTPDAKYTGLALEKPEQYAMSWTTLGGSYETASRDWLPQFAAALTDPAEATRQFWPTIARYGLPFNLIFLQYVGPDDQSHKEKLGAAWSPQMEEAHQAGDLYVIDMTFFTQFPASAISGQPPRFTPGTETYLVRDPVTRTIAPVGVSVSDSNGNKVVYGETDPAWLYALAAAKVSMTVWGIWIGHVYQWHIVTAAMQMTMFQLLPADHPVRQVFGRQSEYLIAFDQFLLLDWTISPPTSVTSNAQFITLLDAFAKGRNFFDDDPDMTIKRLGLRMEDFTTESDLAGNAWNEYPALRYLLMLFEATGRYVGRVVDAIYPDDAHVAGDAALQSWITQSGSPGGGNVRGLPPMTTRAALKRVLTSLIYRVTAHGSSRINQAINPGMTYLGNYPPCLQNTTIPPRDTPFAFKATSASPPGTQSLADFLPNTGTIGEQIAFGFMFIYTPPYTPFIPLGGIEAELPFGSKDASDPRNQALIQYRRDLTHFLTVFAQESKVPGPPAQVTQWELSIET
jgi:hypothetical protein